MQRYQWSQRPIYGDDLNYLIGTPKNPCEKSRDQKSSKGSNPGIISFVPINDFFHLGRELSLTKWNFNENRLFLESLQKESFWKRKTQFFGKGAFPLQ